MKLPTVVVTGASGFIGRETCLRLIERGYSVRAATSDPGKLDSLQACLTQMLDARETDGCCTGGESSKEPAMQTVDAVYIPSPLTCLESWERVCEGVEAIIHLAGRAHILRETVSDPLSVFRAANRDTTAALATSAVSAGVKRMVYVSSIGVNGDATYGRPMRETDPPRPHDPYSQSKLEAENELRALSERSSLEVVMVRPPLVYGPEAKGNFTRLLRLVDLALPLPFSMVTNKRSFISVENLVDALIACAFHPSAAGQVILVSDGEDWSTSKLIQHIGNYMQRPVRLFPVPVPLLELAGRLTGQSGAISRLCGSLEIDIGRIRERLDWSPPQSTEQGLQKAVTWYVQQVRK